MILDPGLINPDHIAHLFALIVISHTLFPSIKIKGTVSTRKCAKDFVRYQLVSITKLTWLPTTTLLAVQSEVDKIRKPRVIIPENHWVENWTSPAFDALGERDEEIEI